MLVRKLVRVFNISFGFGGIFAESLAGGGFHCALALGVQIRIQVASKVVTSFE
jgi:hypothetical protein